MNLPETDDERYAVDVILAALRNKEGIGHRFNAIVLVKEGTRVLIKISGWPGLLSTIQGFIDGGADVDIMITKIDFDKLP